MVDTLAATLPPMCVTLFGTYWLSRVMRRLESAKIKNLQTRLAEAERTAADLYVEIDRVKSEARSEIEALLPAPEPEAEPLATGAAAMLDTLRRAGYPPPGPVRLADVPPGLWSQVNFSAFYRDERQLLFVRAHAFVGVEDIERGWFVRIDEEPECVVEAKAVVELGQGFIHLWDELPIEEVGDGDYQVHSVQYLPISLRVIELEVERPVEPEEGPAHRRLTLAGGPETSNHQREAR